MANLVYRLSTKVDKISGKAEILSRFYHGKKNIFRGKTGIYVLPEYWDAEKQTVKVPNSRFNSPEKEQMIKDLSEIKADLESLSKEVLEAFLEDGGGKVEHPIDWLDSFLNERIMRKEKAKKNEVQTRKEGVREDTNPRTTKRESNSRQEHFFATFRYFISIQKVSVSRIRQYHVIERALTRFGIYNRQEVSFETFSSDLIRKFSEYLEIEHTFVGTDKDGNPCIIDPTFREAYDAVPECRFPKRRGQNTIIGIMSRMHTFLRWASKKGYMLRDPFDDYTIGTAVYGTPFYLTKEERNQLYQASYPDNPGLDVQRDIFVFQCFIGCRVGDLMKMTKANVINGAVEYVPRKTKEGHPVTVRVPLSPTALEILEKYKDLPGDKLLPFICEQDYNRDIKKMIRLAGIDRMVTTLNSITREEEKHPIWEVASSHMARRVLIGNLYKEVKDPNLIAKISGHVENSAAFNRYRDIDEEMAKEVIMKLE